MKKTKILLIDLVTAVFLATVVVVLLVGTDRGLNYLSLTISEKIVMARNDR